MAKDVTQGAQPPSPRNWAALHYNGQSTNKAVLENSKKYRLQRASGGVWSNLLFSAGLLQTLEQAT